MKTKYEDKYNARTIAETKILTTSETAMDRAKVFEKSVYITSDDFRDYLFNTYFSENILKNNNSVPLLAKNVLCTRPDWNEFVRTAFKDKMICMFSEWNGLICENNSILEYSTSNASVAIKLYGIDTSLMDLVLDEFSEVGSQIEWVYSERGDSIEIPLNMDRLPVSEMYPFLKGRTLENYYDSFLNSNSNILLLIGPPGTGKSSFVRGLLAHSGSSAVLTYDGSILERDSIFANFITSEHRVMVLEDSDNFLKSRTEGNNMMHKFLNLGDGLVSTKSKKIVFTTNLPNIRDIDAALLRPGRCFDVADFSLLDQTQAEVLAKKYNIKLNEPRKSWSIAEVFGAEAHDTPTPTRKAKNIGFF